MLMLAGNKLTLVHSLLVSTQRVVVCRECKRTVGVSTTDLVGRSVIFPFFKFCFRTICARRADVSISSWNSSAVPDEQLHINSLCHWLSTSAVR